MGKITKNRKKKRTVKETLRSKMIANIKKQQQLQQQLLVKKQQFNQPNSPLNAIRGMNLQQLSQSGGIPNTPIITPPGSSGKSLTKTDLGILSDAKHAQQMAEYKEREMKMKLEEEKKRYEAVNAANIDILKNLSTMNIQEAIDKINTDDLTPEQRKELSDIQADYAAKNSMVATLEARKQKLKESYDKAFEKDAYGNYSKDSTVMSVAQKQADILELQDEIAMLEKIEEAKNKEIELAANIEAQRVYRKRIITDYDEDAKVLRDDINTIKKRLDTKNNELYILNAKRKDKQTKAEKEKIETMKGELAKDQNELITKQQKLSDILNNTTDDTLILKAKENPTLKKLQAELESKQKELADLEKENFVARKLQIENEATIKGIKATNDRIIELKIDTEATKRENKLTRQTIESYKDLKLEDQYNTAIKLNILNKKLAKDTALKIAKQEALQNEINKMEIENEKLALEKAAYGTIDDETQKTALEQKYRENAKEKEIIESTKAANKSMHERMRLQEDYNAKNNKYNDDKITEAHNDAAKEEKQLNDIKAKIDRQNEIKKTIETVRKAIEKKKNEIDNKKKQLDELTQNTNKIYDDITSKSFGDMVKHNYFKTVPTDEEFNTWPSQHYAVKFDDSDNYDILTKQQLQDTAKAKNIPFKAISLTSDYAPLTQISPDDFKEQIEQKLDIYSKAKYVEEQRDKVINEERKKLNLADLYKLQETIGNMQEQTVKATEQIRDTYGVLLKDGDFTVNEEYKPGNINMNTPYQMFLNAPFDQNIGPTNALTRLGGKYKFIDDVITAEQTRLGKEGAIEMSAEILEQLNSEGNKRSIIEAANQGPFCQNNQSQNEDLKHLLCNDDTAEYYNLQRPNGMPNDD